jgi:hypothetical protein
MKPIKLAILATAATFVLGVSNSKAAIGVTTNYSKVNFSLTVTTNGLSTSKTVTGGTLYTYPTGTVKIGNKQLLDLTAHWAGADRTIDPWKSAKLVVGWDSTWDGDVLVVDKTGTNVLYNADSGSAYFYVEFDYYDGAYTETELDADPGYEAWMETHTAYFYLYDDGTYLPYTDIWSYGGDKQSFKQSWNASGNYTTWSDSESAVFPYTGDEYFLDSGEETTCSGTVSASGSGKGDNYYWY